MKLDDVGPPPRVPAARTQPFQALLDEARVDPRPPPLPRTSLSLVPPPIRRSPAATKSAPGHRPVLVSVMRDAEARQAAEAATLGRARVVSEAQRLRTVRAQHEACAERGTTFRQEAVSEGERAATQVVELIVKELLAELSTPAALGGPHNPLTMNMTPAPVAGSTTSTSVTSRAPEVTPAHAAALIEKIELFVRSQRPALQLTLDNSLGARVEIERLGPGQVALKLVGRDGPPSADAVSRIREELRERGLRVAALTVA